MNASSISDPVPTRVGVRASTGVINEAGLVPGSGAIVVCATSRPPSNTPCPLDRVGEGAPRREKGRLHLPEDDPLPVQSPPARLSPAGAIIQQAAP